HMNGETDYYENVHRMRHRDGHWVYILDRGKIVDWNADGLPIRFTGTHTDITAQKKLEIQAEQASQAKTIFLANVSHELRTPIHGMLGMVELLNRGNLDAEQSKYLAHISESGRSLLSLVNDLLEFSRVEARDLTLSDGDFGIDDFVSTLRQQFEPQFGERGLSFSVELSPRMPGEIRCDELRLKQVISNLLVNALKYTEHGSVRLRIFPVSSFHPSPGLLVEVEDSGRGIRSENIQRIFESFVQEEFAGKPGQGGVGLGLSISKALVERMGGQLEILSDIGKGTIARFSIPVKNGQASKEQKEPSDLWFAENSFGILLVEDTPLNQLLMERFLRFIGLDCETVSSGTDCLERVGRGGIDLVLLDLGLPDHSGLHVAGEIRSNSVHQPYIVAVTADAFEDTRSKCQEAGINDFLPKPFDLEQLSACIGKFVEHSKSVQASAAIDA
ncbi:MAG: response regulator, partial [Leptospiraceae bacterium]|nr:response regulator [Leptospiraceae bacterium]